MSNTITPLVFMQTILLIDKPKGMTSFDVIRRLRSEYREQTGSKAPKMGHAGTLDPLASGLMLLGTGEGTKQLANLIKLDKVYEAEIILGEKRDTGDLEGEIIEECVVEEVDEKRVQNTLESMIGVLSLPVPMYSAVKQGGEKLYKKARRGEEVEVPMKDMKVLDAKLSNSEQHGERVHVFVVFEVGSGAYIRSLAEEFGRRLGYPATLGNLRRTRVGEFSVRDARML